MIRSLKPGDPIPSGEPRRYRSSHGYMRLRWKIGKRRYVEVYEHRVVDGVVTDAPEVHHLNRVKHDNRPENLALVTTAEHREHHRTIDRAKVAHLYRSGLTMPQVAREIGTDHGNISRILRSVGVQIRRPRDYAPFVARDALVEAAADPSVNSAKDLAVRFDVPVPTIRRLMREYGIPSFDVGRPRRRGPLTADERQERNRKTAEAVGRLLDLHGGPDEGGAV